MQPSWSRIVIVAAAAGVAATATAYTAHASATRARAGAQVVDKTYSCRVWRQNPFYFGTQVRLPATASGSRARARERDHGERPRLSGRVQGCEEQPEGRQVDLPSFFATGRAQARRAHPLSDGDDPHHRAPQWQVPDACQPRARPLPDRDDRAHRSRRCSPSARAMREVGRSPSSSGARTRSRATWPRAAPRSEEADGETRTPDPIITSDVLYQLSYVGGGAQFSPAQNSIVTSVPIGV